MGAKSTLDLTRAEALAFIIQNLYNVDDRTIANLVEELNDALRNAGEDNMGLHNFCVRS